MTRIRGGADPKFGRLHPDDPGLPNIPPWSKDNLLAMDRAALLAMAKWHSVMAVAALKMNRMMDEGSQRRCA